MTTPGDFEAKEVVGSNRPIRLSVDKRHGDAIWDALPSSIPTDSFRGPSQALGQLDSRNTVQTHPFFEGHYGNSLQHRNGVVDGEKSTPKWSMGSQHQFGADRHMASVNNIAAMREKRRWSRPELARRMGTSPQQVERLEKGQRNLKQEWIDRAAQAFGVEPAAIITPMDGLELPVVGFVGAGGAITFEDAYAPGDGMYFTEPMPGMDASRLIGLEVRGDSMYPIFRNGHIVFIGRDGWDHVEKEALQDWAVCRLVDGRTLLKEIRPSRDHGKYDLISQNAPPIEAVELHWATPVLGHRRR